MRLKVVVSKGIRWFEGTGCSESDFGLLLLPLFKASMTERAIASESLRSRVAFLCDDVSAVEQFSVWLTVGFPKTLPSLESKVERLARVPIVVVTVDSTTSLPLTQRRVIVALISESGAASDDSLKEIWSKPGDDGGERRRGMDRSSVS